MPKKSSVPKTGTRLEPLRVLARITNVNNQELVAATGKTTIALYKWFKDDDLKMDSLAMMAERCGYVVYAALSKSPVVDRDLFTQVTPAKSLIFVMRSLEYYGYNRETAAEKAGVLLSTFNGWLYKQQCSMSNIIELGAKLGMTLVIEYRKMQTMNELPKSGGLYSTIEGLQYYCK